LASRRLDRGCDPQISGGEPGAILASHYAGEFQKTREET
jgi:hypothetical protein